MNSIDAWQFLWLLILSSFILLAFVSSVDDKWDFFTPYKNPRYGPKATVPEPAPEKPKEKRRRGGRR